MVSLFYQTDQVSVSEVELVLFGDTTADGRHEDDVNNSTRTAPSCDANTDCYPLRRLDYCM